MPDDHITRLARARTALEGLSVGDAFGENFFAMDSYIQRVVAERRVPPPPWYFTDDTNMALSVFETLRLHQHIDQDALATSFAEHYHPHRGYGMAMHGLLAAYRQGADWREVAPTLFGGTGSFGNGAAMRIAPLGGYYADHLDACAEQARRATEVTHAHPEALAGGIAAAVAAGVAWQLRDARPHPARADFINRVLPYVPESAVHKSLITARDLPPHTTVRDAVRALGNGSRITCQDTVAFTLWIAGERLGRYEDALWSTASARGDVDTTCAIVGGIVVLSTGTDGIPEPWTRHRESLPVWPFESSA